MNKMNNFKGKINIEPVYEELELAFSDVGPFRILVDKASEVAAYAISGVLRGDKFPDESVLSLAWTMLDLQQLNDGENKQSVEAACNMANHIMDTYKVHPHFDACIEIVSKLRTHVHKKVGRHEEVDFSITNRFVDWVKEYDKQYKEAVDSLYSHKVISVSQQRRIDLLKEKNAALERGRQELQGKMDSKEFRDEVGRDYVRKMFRRYMGRSKSWGQARREKEYDRLEVFLKLAEVPDDVKEMIEALQEDRSGDSVINVQGNATINDIHNNNTVNTK